MPTPRSSYLRFVLSAALLLLFIAIIFYFLARAIFLTVAGYSLLEKTLAGLFLAAETFVMIHAVGYFSNIYKRAGRDKEKNIPPQIDLDILPPVALLIPARHEPKHVLEQTLMACYNQRYPRKTLYLLDDSSDEHYKNEAAQLATRYGAKLFRRRERHGAKAGIINDCLKTLEEKYAAVFDADQNPMPNFLVETVPFLEADPKLAFVQTPQFYTNLEASKVAFGANMQQAVFYEYVCEGKSSSQAMICCGTNVLLRREAVLSVGGFDESSVTEDFSTSFSLQTQGWKTLYSNHVSVFGMGPEHLESYFKQQYRWAHGNVGLLRTIVTKFFRSPFSLRPLQWFEYFVTSSYYLIGCAYLFLVFCPVIYIFFSIPSFFMNPAVYTLTFFPYFILSLGIFYSTMGSRHYRLSQLFQGQALAFITLPVYARAGLAGLAGIRSMFQVTAKEGMRRISYGRLWPHLVLWAVNLAALTWGINRLIYEPAPAIAINLAWIFYHGFLFTSIFYFNEQD